MLIEISEKELAELLQIPLGAVGAKVLHCGRNVTLDRLRKVGIERKSAIDPRKKIRLFGGHWEVKYHGGDWHPHPGLDEPK